jgi:glutamate--cysteine ligase
MDPARSGLVPPLWSLETPSYEDYVEWALDAGMFLIRRGDTFIENTGQTFRSFLADGYQGYRATRTDWESHVNSLFPEARLKRTLEARSVDSLPRRMACAVPALLAGVLYDDRARDQARELVAPFDYDTVQAARPSLVELGLAGRIGQTPAQDLAERLLEIADGGLERRARLSREGKDERVHLDALRHLVASGRTPADDLIDGVDLESDDVTRDLIRQTAV